MDMKKFTILSFAVLVVLLFLSAVLMELVMQNFFHIVPFSNYYLLPVGFLLAGIVKLLLLNITDRTNPKRLGQIFLIIKTLKNLIVAIFGLVYIFGLHVEIKSFLVVTGVYYMIYLAYETMSLIRFEKLLKKEHV